MKWVSVMAYNYQSVSIIVPTIDTNTGQITQVLEVWFWSKRYGISNPELIKSTSSCQQFTMLQP